MNYTSIGKKIRYLRKKHKFSQQDFAKKIFPSWVIDGNIKISKIENGKFKNEVELILMICIFFKIKLNDLINDSTDIPPSNYFEERSMDNFSINLTKYLKNISLSESELAAKYSKVFCDSISKDSLKKYQNRSRFPSLENIYRLSLLLEIPIDSFFEENNRS